MITRKLKSMSNTPMIVTSGFTSTHLFFYHEGAAVKIYRNRLVVTGSLKNAAFALARDVLNDKAVSTSWNNILEANRSSGKYVLKYLKNNKPDFFDELNQHFQRICNMKAFW
jgi:hypothetical protein